MRKFAKRIVAATVHQIIGIFIAFAVVSIFFPQIHWMQNLKITLTVAVVKILWNLFILPLYKKYLK